jgi:CRP-like cAMP-binding protein
MNRRAFVLGAAMVLLCNFVAVALRAFAETTFIKAYGPAKLPYLFIASAAGFAIATFGYDAITRRAHTRVVDVTLLVALGAIAAAAPSLLGAGIAPAVLVVALAAVSQVAGLALWNRVAASVAGRDARRMLPRAGAAVTAGGAIAGLGAGALVYELGLQVLPYLGAVVTALVVMLMLAQDRALTTGGAPGATAPAGTSEVLGDLQRRLLRGLVAVAVLEGIVSTVIDLQFVAELKATYPEHLGVAVSLFYGGTNAILLLLQVTAVPRILVTRSLPTTAGIHPILALGWYAVFAAAPGFVAIAGTRTSDQVLRLATSRTSQEIELSAFPPGPRARWKVLLRGAMWPVGAALAAVAALAVGPATISGHPARIAVAASAIAVIWWIAGQLTARRFQAALVAPLGIGAHRAEDLRWIDLATLERWSEAAGSDDPRTAALARAALARVRVDATDLADQLRHDDPAVRAALFVKLARSPSPALRGELRAAVEIEDDDRALAAGLEALALAGDDSAQPRGRSRAALSREVAAAVQSAERTLHGGAVADEVALLCERNPAWATGLVRARRAELTDEVLTGVLAGAAGGARRAGALYVIARAGTDASMALLGEALEAGDPAAVEAISGLDASGAAHLAGKLGLLSPLARTAIGRALAGAPAGAALVGTLLGADEPEVAHAALRTALAIARGGEALPAGPIAHANRVALAALVAHLDARDAAAQADGAWSACARHELELATRRCVARLLWATAVEAAAAGRDPAPLAATARVLVNGREADRRRALDVVQELQAGRGEILAVIERWLRPAVPADRAHGLATFDPWLAELAAGRLAEIEPLLVALRRPALFTTIAGPALAELATRARHRTIEGELFAAGATGDTMFVVTAGALHAQRAAAADRVIEVGGVVGELAVLTQAPRAATVVARARAEVLEIDREAFAAAARRAPELLLGLSATLAGWLAPERPDVL